jgi:predicted nuclease of predicted toxin-antitoxin system
MATIRLLLDEDVRVLLAEVLRQRGYDAVHVIERHRGGRSDAEQLAYATAQRRAILTHNIRDYVMLDRDYRSRRRRHQGIIASDQLPFRELLRRTLRCLSRTRAEDMSGHIIWLHDFK